MTVHHQDRTKAGLSFEWEKLPARLFSVAEIRSSAEELLFNRKQNSHRGISDRVQGLRRLRASLKIRSLEPVAGLQNLEFLLLDKPPARRPFPSPVTRAR